jgi:hypothetical protein
MALLFLSLDVAKAQSTIIFQCATEDGNALSYAELCILKNDSVVRFEIVDGPRTQIELPAGALYTANLSSLGYTSAQTTFQCHGDTLIQMSLAKEAVQLEEVVVKGNIQSKKSSTGESFKLSNTAKSTGDPFRALSEIPLLQVDIVNQSVSLRDGTSPLILIDGKMLNTGISPIDPKFIDYVEVTEVVSAKYLQMGVEKIINIHLKRDTPYYVYTEARTRHDIPLREGFGGANFEFGKKKLALAGNLFGNYLLNDKTEYTNEEQLGNLNKVRYGSNKSRSNEISGRLTLKWVPTESDYFAASVYCRDTHAKTNGTSDGLYGASEAVNLSTISKDKLVDGGLLVAAFHEHTFKDKSTFTTYLKYNRGYADNDDRYSETLNQTEDLYQEAEHSNRDQYTLSLDYDSDEKSWGNLAIGDALEYTKDRRYDWVNEAHPRADINSFSNYTHATYSNNWKKLYYMASVGLEHLSTEVQRDFNGYWRPRASASLTWQLPHGQVVRGSYYLTNALPQCTELFMFNHSSNPWLRVEGNPYLVPVQKHYFKVNYDKSLGHFRLQTYLNFYRFRKMIESFLTQNEDIEVQSYRNNGTYRSTQWGGRAIYRNRHFQASANVLYEWESYNGQATKGSVSMDGYLRWDFGRFFIYSTIGWYNKEYTAISTTQYRKPTNAHIQISWQPTRRLYISAALPYYWGTKSNVTYINREGYAKRLATSFKSQSLRPWILIAWTLRKNAEQSIVSKMPD